MNNPTQLLHTDIIVVEVPRDATDISVGSQGFCLYFSHESKRKHIDLSFGKVELLGEATETEINVDYKKFPEALLTGKEANSLLDENDNIDLRKLLQASGLYWVNPIEEPSRNYSGFTNEQIELDKYYWEEVRLYREAENKKIKGKLIFLKKV